MGYFDSWPRAGLLKRSSTFPIAIWQQSPSNAAAWAAAGINVYFYVNGSGTVNGSLGDPTQADINTLRLNGISLVSQWTAGAQALAADPAIVGWVFPQDEPDDANGAITGPRYTAAQVVGTAAAMRMVDGTRPIVCSFSQGLGNDLGFNRGSIPSVFPGDDAYHGVAMPGVDVVACSLFPIASLGQNPPLATVVDGRNYLWNIIQAVNRSKQYSVGKPHWQQIEATHVSNPGAFVTGTPTATPQTGTGSLASGTYFYRITGVDWAGESAGSAEATATLAATGQINLSWTGITGASTYNVYRSTTTNAEKQLVTGLATHSYTDNGGATPNSTSYPTAESSRPLVTQQWMTAEAWLAIIHGANALIWFVHEFDYQGNFITDTAPLLGNTATGAATANWPNQLTYLTTTNANIQALASVINSTPPPAGLVTISSSATSPVNFTVRQSGGHLYVFAASAHNAGPVTATFTLPYGTTLASATVLNESRNVTVTQLASGGAQFSDTFNAYDVHLYQI